MGIQANMLSCSFNKIVRLLKLEDFPSHRATCKTLRSLLTERTVKCVIHLLIQANSELDNTNFLACLKVNFEDPFKQVTGNYEIYHF